MKKNFYFVLLLAVVLLYFSCAETAKVTTGFPSEVPIAGNLTFNFDYDVVESVECNKWDSTEYIIFEPEIKGRFKWLSPRKLIFSPYKYLTPATEYKATFNKKAFKDYDKKIDKTSFVFNTAFLKFDKLSGYWTTNEYEIYQPFVVLELNFNYRINPADIVEHIVVEIDGVQKDFKILKKDISKNLSIYVTDISLEDKEMNIKVTTKSGLPGYDVQTTIKENISQEIKIQSPLNFLITASYGEHDGFAGTIFIETSQEINADKLDTYISISPNVEFTVEKNGLSTIITSKDFEISKKYTVTLKKNVTGILGGVLKYDYVNEIQFGELDAAIKFVDKKAVYLSAKGEKNLQLYLVNVPQLNVKVTKVYENNIISYLGTGYYYYDYYYDIYDYDWGYGDEHPGTYGDVVYETIIDTKTLPENGNFRLFNFNIQDKLKDYNGLYVLELNSEDDYWVRKRKIIALSDIGLIVKKGINTITVFANSISTAKELPGVKIKFVGKNNQEITSKITDDKGVVVYDLTDLKAENFETMLITASLNNDFNYIHFSRSQISTSNFEVGGSSINTAGYDAFIYPQRDIYRPDETIHLSAIIRDAQLKTPAEIPVVMNVLAPNGNIYKTIKKTLNKSGSFETELYIPADAMTGTYYFELYTANKIFLSSKAVMVEEFMPDRIKVEIELENENQKLEEEAVLNITATNLFGPPAKDRKYDVTQSLYLKYFTPKEYTDYNFNISDRREYFDAIKREGITDENGQSTEKFTIDKTFANMGIIRANYFVSVFDENGRTVNRYINSDIYTQDVFYGIKYPEYYNKIATPMTFNLIALDKDEKLLSNTQAQIIIIKHEYNTVLAKDGSYYRYKSEHSEVVLKDEKITLNGTSTNFVFTPETTGQYDIKISKPDVPTYVVCSFYAYGKGATTNNAFNVDTEGKIDIELDKEKYNVGEKANVLLKTPFSGKILVTIENDNVVKYFYLDSDKKTASFELEILDSYIPNVYITATLFRPHTVSELPIMTAHGFAPVICENPDNKLPIVITAAETSKSNTKQTIKIKSKPNTAITLAVVDEGILQLTGFETPDPYQHFYRKRALNVLSYDIYPYLFPEFISKDALKGGDGMFDLSKRINPLTNKRVKLVSFWSGIIETDSEGNASINIEIPQFSGSLRIMAVAYKDAKFASAEANMTVADDIVISTGLPRFLAPTDEIEVPITITNTTDKTANCKVNIQLSDNLEIQGTTTNEATINAKQEHKIIYKVKAKNEIGNANLIVTVSALASEFKENLDITIRPATTLQKTFGSGEIAAGSTKNIIIDASRFIDKSSDKKLVLTNSPLIQFTKDLDYLLTYPYGCVEQIVATTFPQLYYSELAKAILGEHVNKTYITNNINEAIRKLKLMQIYNGGLTYWEGEGSESWWGTAFAAHFLLEAKKLDYEVDDNMLNLMLSYLEIRLKDKETTTYYYNVNQKKVIAPKVAAYSIFVLALAKQPAKATMNYYKSNLDLLSLDSKYLLAAAFSLIGDNESYKTVLPNEFAGEESVAVHSGDFYSPIRDQAIALYCLLETSSTDPQIGIMAKQLSEKMTKKTHLNTQESVFAFLAMGRIAKLAEASNVNAIIKADTKEIAKYNNVLLTLNKKDLTSNNIEVITTGIGKLYYFWNAEGLTADGSYNETDNLLQVRRHFYSEGNEITNNTFKQGDLILVRIVLKSTMEAPIDNVVITDILPAGLEIENSRLTLVPNIVAPTAIAYPQYLDMRDDRISFFDAATATEKNYYYLARAVTKGSFKIGPVSADAMYNAEYFSYHGGGTVNITE